MLCRSTTWQLRKYLGRYGCIGKNLALSELQVVTALLVRTYHIKLVPDEDGSRVEKEMTDRFTVLPGPLRLTFERRNFMV